MVLTLRHHNFQADLEGRTPDLWYSENYIVSDSREVGRIYKVPTGENEGQWVWYFHLSGLDDRIPTSGHAGSMDEAKMRFAASWEAAMRQKRR